MKAFNPRTACLTLLGATLWMPSVALAVPGDLGLNVMLQPWDPWTNDDEPIRVLDDPALISRSFGDAWIATSGDMHQRLTNILGQGDLIAEGITLYDIDLRIGMPQLSARRLASDGTDNLLLGVSLKFGDIHLEATSTTPDVAFGIGVDGALDPRCSLDFELTVDVPLGIGSDVAHPLFSDITPADAATRPVARISNFRIDSQNFSCDVLVGAMSLLGFDEVLSQAVQDPGQPEAVALNRALIEQYLTALQAVDNAVSALVPGGYSRINAWAEGADETQLTLAFGVRGPFPDDVVRASLSGTLSAQSDEVGFQGALDASLCEAISVRATRKTGPRPILTSSGMLGDDPLETIEASLACWDGDVAGQVVYVLDGLSPTFPNFLNLSSSSGCDVSDMSSIETGIRVRLANGAPFSVFLAADLAHPWDLEAIRYSELCGAKASAVPNPIPSEDNCIFCGSWLPPGSQQVQPGDLYVPAGGIVVPPIQLPPIVLQQRR